MYVNYLGLADHIYFDNIMANGILSVVQHTQIVALLQKNNLHLMNNFPDHIN